MLGNPLVSIGLAALIVAGAVHMNLGMQVIIEDYIHQTGSRRMLLGASTVFSVFIVFSTLYALLRLTLGF
jgi:succinate dehydrogenase / fumarate reductase membrane anchor subunit